jgi:hypothetical protein
MLDRLNSVIVCALFGALVFFYAQQVWLSSHPPRSDEVRGAHYSEIKKDEIYGPYRWKWGESDPALAFFTFCLSFIAAVQAGLFVWQLRYMRDGVRDAEAAANAAKDSVNAQRDEFAATHRPRVRVKHVYLASDIWQKNRIVINLWCVNTGTTDAKLEEIGIRYHVVREGAMLPADPHIPAAFRTSEVFLQCGINQRIENIDIGRVLSDEENSSIQQEQSKLFCVGYVSYRDAAGRLRITGFCRVLVFPHNTTARADNSRFRIFKDPDYEYED